MTAMVPEALLIEACELLVQAGRAMGWNATADFSPDLAEWWAEHTKPRKPKTARGAIRIIDHNKQ